MNEQSDESLALDECDDDKDTLREDVLCMCEREWQQG